MGEEAKKVEELKEKETKPEKPSEDGKKPDEDTKAGEPSPSQPPPPSSQEIVLRVFMHCEGCARKVKRSLKGFEGVEEVITDCKSSKVVVKGEKADPLKVLQRVQKKSHRQAELISPIPKPEGDDEPKKAEVKEVLVKPPSEKKEEDSVVVVTVVLGIYMHCEACAQEIKKRIERMKGVENAQPDLKSSQVTVKGTFEPENLTDYVSKRTGKHTTILRVEPEKKKDKKGEKGEKKPEEGEEKNEEPAKENKADAKEARAQNEGGEADDPKLEMRRNEVYYYNYPQNFHLYPAQRFGHEMSGYPPQMFSDENPNACSVM